ncbi:MAG: DeoR/GlpR transcriptional regulator [Chloroflexi bacterium]|nr:MAG: DeoR/GlpR transcriptional regulator [Chloroflexota bacterium]
MKGLLKEERQQQILEALQENKKVTVTELSQRYGTSEVTIRRDLADLAASGRLIRAHRGALAVASAPPEPPIIQRMTIGREEKDRIARAALELVNEGDSLFLGSGSTVACFARYLAGRKKITVSTNAINIAMELASVELDMVVVVLGGVIRAPELSLLGHIAEQSLSEVRFNKIFMGVQALSIENGWTTDHLPEVATTRKILDMAAELIVLADHTKLGQTAAAWIAPAVRITTLVTDAQSESDFLAHLRAEGVRVVVAGR